jgi:hypothetical protein
VLNASTPAATAAAAGSLLVSEDFESGLASEWKVVAGEGQVARLDGGNHALKLVQNEFDGAQIVFIPSWAWKESNYTFEADVMAGAVEPLTTALRLDFAVVSEQADRSCLNYFAELGSGWSRLGRQTADGGNCSSAWEVANLAPERDFELQPGVWHHLRLDVRDGTFHFYVDGTLSDSAGDSQDTYGAGGIGLSVLHTPEAYVDNIEVRSDPGSAR